MVFWQCSVALISFANARTKIGCNEHLRFSVTSERDVYAIPRLSTLHNNRRTETQEAGMSDLSLCSRLRLEGRDIWYVG
jgi:hypothetical protein